MTTKFNVICSDGRRLALTKFESKSGVEKHVIIINSALGIKQAYYQNIAEYLQNQNCTVITWDPRGIGGSRLNNIKQDKAKLREWGSHDLDAVLNYVVNQGWVQWQDIHLIGHSAGGQIVGLCPSIYKIKHLYLICSGTGNWRLYSKKQWPRMLAAWYLLVPTMLAIFGYIPAKWGVGHDLPKGIAQDWRNWCLNKDYLFSDSSIGETYFDKFEGQLHAFGFNDDVGFTPKSTMHDLIRRFSRANKTLEIYHPAQFMQKKIGHFGYFKLKDESVWMKTLLTPILETSLNTPNDELMPSEK